jgi:uncharacterized protein YndB with AHSA1/START domain
MKTYTYSIEINKPVAVVFDKVTNPEVYPAWAKAWSENGESMDMQGNWQEGTTMSFFDKSGSGTKVLVEEVKQNECIKMKHIAMVKNKDEDITELDDVMKKWIGSREDYFFTAIDENTTKFEAVNVTDEAFEEMLQVWPQALQYLKEVCEAD